MLFKSGLVTQVSGSVGGITGSHNAGGMYFRSRVVPVNPSSTAQRRARNAVGYLVSAWGNLTAPQREAWETYAANVPLVNRLGEARNVSGIAMFVRSNVSLIVAAVAPADLHLDAPTTFDLGEVSPMTLSASAATQNLSIAYEDGDDWVSEDDARLFVHGSRPFSPNRNYFTGPYRYAFVLDGDSGAPPASPVEDKNPFAFVEGQQLGCYARVSRADGRLSGRIRLSCIAAA